MKHLLNFLIIIFYAMTVQAQLSSGNCSISGRIRDSVTRASVDYASVALFRQGDKAPVNGMTSDPKGNFRISNLQEGEYSIRISFIGYRNLGIDHIRVTAQQPQVSLNEVYLRPTGQMLNSVNVTAKMPAVQNKTDKLVYDPSNDLTVQGGTASDILKKVPMVTVDIDGNVELLGSPGINFLINGKPSTIFGTSLADVLQSIPASQIKNIEVITNPGAKYDAQGTGGIINIILKDSNLKGFNGTVNTSAGTRVQNGSLNLNARKGNFGVNAFFSGNNQLNTRTLNTKQLTDSLGRMLLKQTGDNIIQRTGYQTGLNLDWKITPHDNITAGVSYDQFTNHTFGLTSQQQTSFVTGLPVYTNSARNADYHTLESSLQWNLAYKKTFKKDRQELNILYESNIDHSNFDYAQQQNYISPMLPATGSSSHAPGRIHETTFQADYVQPVAKNFTLETGAKAFFKTINSNTGFFQYDPMSQSYTYDPIQSYSFVYDRNIYAYYLSANLKAFNFFDVQAGGRYEYTYTKADFPNTNIPSYGTFNPSFTISRQINKSQLIKFSYSHRIERGDYDELNPFVNRSDPYNLTTGNPNLRPELGNNYELGYSKLFNQGASVNMTAFYRKNANDIQTYTMFYPTYQEGNTIYDNVSLTQRINTGSENRTGINIYTNIPIGNHLTLRSNMMFSHKTILYHYSGLQQDARGFEYRANLNVAYDFPNDYSAEAFGNYQSNKVGLQGSYPAFVFYTLAFRKQFDHKKLSLGLTATDPFNQYINQTSILMQGGNRQYTLRQVPYQSFGISLSYKFGTLQFEKEEKKQDPDVPTY